MLKWVVAAVAAVVVGAGLWAFEPWRLFTSSEVDEALPTVAAASPVAGAPSPSPTADSSPEPPSPEPEPEPEIVELVSGPFEDAEHDTTGQARILELSDGSRFLRLEGLATSDGPDLHVWLSDAPSGGAWGSYDDGRYLRLGELKATNGNQNYEIPADADLSGLDTAVIWCDRFDVAFGTAPLS
ncbi:DM13 domain-containing protein [Nocardioides sp.]|uniref:DM13 domain-containing protein n=1 Tax=Nocardioides sp. TaxID=35761 RepID=UPI00286A7531|nr:DM13 domain-containing protein [Nocardioides sp.]